MYKLISTHQVFGKPNCILRLSDGACVPFDPDNTDYQEFLRWCEAGNTPEPADQPELTNE